MKKWGGNFPSKAKNKNDTPGAIEQSGLISYGEFWKILNIDLSLRIAFLILMEFELFPKPLSLIHHPNQYFFDPVQVDQARFLLPFFNSDETIKSLRGKLPNFWPIQNPTFLKNKTLSEGPKDQFQNSPEIPISKMEFPFSFRLKFRFSKKYKEIFVKSLVTAFVGYFSRPNLSLNRYVELFFFPKTLQENLAKILAVNDSLIGWDMYSLEREMAQNIQKEFERKNVHLEDLHLSEFTNILATSFEILENLKKEAKNWVNTRNLEPVFQEEQVELVWQIIRKDLPKFSEKNSSSNWVQIISSALSNSLIELFKNLIRHI